MQKGTRVCGRGMVFGATLMLACLFTSGHVLAEDPATLSNDYLNVRIEPNGARISHLASGDAVFTY